MDNKNTEFDEFKFEELSTASSVKAKSVTWDSACRLFSPLEEDQELTIPKPISNK